MGQQLCAVILPVVTEQYVHSVNLMSYARFPSVSICSQRGHRGIISD